MFVFHLPELNEFLETLAKFPREGDRVFPAAETSYGGFQNHFISLAETDLT